MQLEHSHLWKTEIATGEVVTVERGGLWLTFEGQDIVLQTGQHWAAPQHGEVMAQSLGGDASFTIAPTRKHPITDAKRQHRRNWFSMLFEPQMKPHL